MTTTFEIAHCCEYIVITRGVSGFGFTAVLMELSVIILADMICGFNFDFGGRIGSLPELYRLSCFANMQATMAV